MDRIEALLAEAQEKVCIKDSWTQLNLPSVCFCRYRLSPFLILTSFAYI
jgi:hypothetical protein